MQMCDVCMKVYDESEDPMCPYCVEGENSEPSYCCEACSDTGKEECYVCDGDGLNPDDTDEVCPECKGEGEIDCADCLDNGRI